MIENYLEDLHSIVSFSLEQKTVNSIKNTLERGVGGPVTVKDAVTDTTMAIDVGVIEAGDKTAFGREGGEVVRHLKVEHKVAVLIRSFGGLLHITHVSGLSKSRNINQNLRLA